MKKLTRAEEEMMLILWKLEKAFLKDIVAAYPEPKPNQSTISTILRTLEKKGFAEHRAYSKTFEYYPIVTKRSYRSVFFRDFLDKYFEGSYEELVTFLSSELDMQFRVPEPPEKPVEKAPEKGKAAKEPDAEDSKFQLSLF
jgi:BlaI family transcriptional regulator, penicillinase repressor